MILVKFIFFFVIPNIKVNLFQNNMKNKLDLKRVVMEVFGGCNYTCQMCPQIILVEERVLLEKFSSI